MLPIARAVVLCVAVALPGLGLQSAPEESRFSLAPEARSAGLSAVVVEWAESERVQPSACVDCAEQLWCSVHSHIAYTDANGPAVGAHDDCRPERWCSGHPSCGTVINNGPVVDPALLQEFVDRALSGRQADVIALAEAYPSKVVLNSRRGALQVKGACDSAGLIAHIPLDDAIYQEVDEVTNGRDEVRGE